MEYGYAYSLVGAPTTAETTAETIAAAAGAYLGVTTYIFSHTLII